MVCDAPHLDRRSGSSNVFYLVSSPSGYGIVTFFSGLSTALSGGIGSLGEMFTVLIAVGVSFL